MLLASCLAGISFNAAGLGICHALAHALGGRYHIPHGRLNAMLLPHVIAFNSADKGAADKYARLSGLCGLAKNPRALIGGVKRLRAGLGMPEKLTACGVEGQTLLADLDSIAQAALADVCAPGNPRPCLLYTSNEGRGTTKAFELISAPYIDPIDLAQRMNELNLPGVQFRPASITVYSGNQTTGANYTNELSHGVQIHITDKRACSPIQMQTALFLMLQAMYAGTGDQAFNMPNSVDTRVGVSWVREEIQAFPKGATNEQVMEKTNEMLARMDEEVQDYLVIRDKYLMDEYNTPDDKELVNTRQPVVTLGYENLLANHMDLLEGKKVGLVANETSVDKDLNHLADTLIAKGVNLTTLFSTGTGLRGEFQTSEAGQYTDSPVSQKGTGLPVYRLTDEGPTAEQLKDVDVLLFDMQDSGTRANSCVNLMADCMLSCAENGKSFRCV